MRKHDESVLFNCGNGRGYSVLEVIRAVEAASGKPLARKLDARRAGDPPALIADPSALLSALAWRAEYGLDDMVRTALAWERRTHRAAPSA
jgi:UDP-glucose 4-epimerase